jgi:hypothetical protein
MAHWGIAYAAGPNYNKQWKAFDAADLKRSLNTAFKSTQKALACLQKASPVEQALIRPLAERYPCADASAVTTAWNDNYAGSMRKVYRAHRDDLDVATLFAEAIMNRTPWQMWDTKARTPAPGADTTEAIAVLERSLAQAGGMQHPGLLHAYVHLMEMSPHPERALRAADALRTAVPDAGHLVHMPTHIDVLCGHYKDATGTGGPSPSTANSSSSGDRRISIRSIAATTITSGSMARCSSAITGRQLTRQSK